MENLRRHFKVKDVEEGKEGSQLLKLPPVLVLELYNRVEKRVTFTDELKLNEFLVKKEENQNYTYHLHGVITAMNNFHKTGGHATIFIKNQDGWRHFNNSRVSRVSEADAIEGSFGGVPDKFRTHNRHASHLVYLRDSSSEKVVRPITSEDVPDALQVRFAKEQKANEEQIRLSKEKKERKKARKEKKESERKMNQDGE